MIEVLTLKVVWKILDGVGDAIDGTVEEISDFLFERLNKQAEGGEVKTLVHLISVFGCSIDFIFTLSALCQVDEADFINFCAKVGELTQHTFISLLLRILLWVTV